MRFKSGCPEKTIPNMSNTSRSCQSAAGQTLTTLGTSSASAACTFTLSRSFFAKEYRSRTTSNRFSRFGQSTAVKSASMSNFSFILTLDRARLVEIALHLRDGEKFDMLADLTAVDWPKREKRFDVVLDLYSFAKNERLRVKVHAADAEEVPSVVSVWPAADWQEREVFDMFGIVFSVHPDLKRILLPDEWQGYPLRKDYDILQQDTAWVRENLGIESGQ